MCLVLFAFQYHDDYPLIMAANRDEYYTRPTRSAQFWEDHPQLFAGKDLTAKGTWMGITTTGRFAAVTNFREHMPLQQTDNTALVSRGHLTNNYLTQNITHDQYLADLANTKLHYAGYNLLMGNAQQLSYYNNRIAMTQHLTPGIYGLSNGLINEPWPKVKSGKQALQECLKHTVDPTQLLNILQDCTQASDNTLPNTGIDLDKERQLSSRFIHTPNYGTRTSTVLMLTRQGEALVWEKNYIPGTFEGEMNKVRFTIAS